MLDVAPTELLVVVVVAVLVIGPKDLPKAMRFVGQWVGRARAVARQFRSGIDAVIREAELQEMEKKWAEENERIMREYPSKLLESPDKSERAAAAGDRASPTDESPEQRASDDHEPQLPLESAVSETNAIIEKPAITDESDGAGSDRKDGGAAQ